MNNVISLRLPESLDKTVRELSEEEHISIEQFITIALAEKISALMTEDYLEQRARRGSRAKFERAMHKVADVEPEEYDKL
jgi:hypothetical protein